MISIVHLAPVFSAEAENSRRLFDYRLFLHTSAYRLEV